MDGKGRVISWLMIAVSMIASMVFCFAIVPGAHATEDVLSTDEVDSHQVEENGSTVQEHFGFTDGTSVQFDYDRTTGTIEVYRNGFLVKTTTVRKIIQEIRQKLPVVGTFSGTNMLSGSGGRCSTAMNIANVANAALWGAAGIVAAPSAGVSIAVGGLITGGVLGAVAFFCK